MDMIYHPPPDQGLDILFEDEYLLVVNKPAGLLSVPGRGADKQDCMSRRVMERFPQALVVHRLDMETSGLLLFALDKPTQSALGNLFAQRAVHKRYQAIVSGDVKVDQGEIILPLCTDWPNRPRQKVDFSMGKPSYTRYRVLEHLPGQGTRLSLNPLTGRSHQLRVHLLALGHPIVGDRLYGVPGPEAKPHRMLLHADLLKFLHPWRQTPLQFHCPASF